MTMTLNEKMVCDNLIDDDKVTRQKEAKAKSAKKYMDKLKQDECAMDKIRMQKMDYYIKTKNQSEKKNVLGIMRILKLENVKKKNLICTIITNLTMSPK